MDRRLSVEPTDADFGGTWKSTYGTLRLTQAGNRVTGTYTSPVGATIEGVVTGRVVTGTYHEPATNGEGVRGRLVLEIDETGSSFSGKWREGLALPLMPSDPTAGNWSGERLQYTSNRVWLVILEANWEESLHEREYSFGVMLRSFFDRVPTVEIRHRFVHHKPDLDRFCAELSGLMEPVVLYVSSHGTPEGICLGTDVITPEQLGTALRTVNDLRLLHLGSCALLAGDAPDRIRAAAAPHAPFPISGFVESVDWASSAIVDLSYMDLILEQGMDPIDAVAAVRRMITFAGEPKSQGKQWLPACDIKVSTSK